MTKVQDTKRVLKLYALGHEAVRADLSAFLDYASRPSTDRYKLLPEFRKFFLLNHRLWGYELLNFDHVTFPVLQPYLQDAEQLAEYVHDQQEKINEISSAIARDLRRNDASDQVSENIRKLVEAVEKYLEHQETIFIPVMMSVGTSGARKKAERATFGKIGVTGALVMWCWMLTRIPQKDRADVLGMLPFPIQLLYTGVVERIFLVRYPRWVASFSSK